MKRIDIVGQNGNDGLHYEEKDIDKKWDQMKPVGKEFEYELDKSTGEVVKKYVDILHNDGFKKVKKDVELPNNEEV